MQANSSTPARREGRGEVSEEEAERWGWRARGNPETGGIFDGVGRLTGSESLRSPTDLGSSSHRKRHSRGPPRFRPPSRPGSSRGSPMLIRP